MSQLSVDLLLVLLPARTAEETSLANSIYLKSMDCSMVAEPTFLSDDILEKSDCAS